MSGNEKIPASLNDLRELLASDDYVAGKIALLNRWAEGNEKELDRLAMLIAKNGCS